MTSLAFNRWLADMKLAGLAKSDAAAARLLDLSPNAIVKIKRNGTDHRTALACAALLHKMGAYA
jgi:hypothetical protein